MSVDYVRTERMYRAYMEFFEIAEKKRRWNIWDDIPWEKLKPELNDEADAIRVETFCGVELYVPDYTAHGFNMSRVDLRTGLVRRQLGLRGIQTRAGVP